MLYHKIVDKYFGSLNDYTEDPDRREVSFNIEGSDIQDDPDFAIHLDIISHILEPSLITHQITIREGNAGCGDPECCGYNYNNYTVAIVMTGVRFTEEDSRNPVVKIEKLEEVDYT